MSGKCSILSGSERLIYMMDEQSANDGQSNMADDAENVPEMRDDALKYKSEAERVESFRCNWPIPQHINPKDLARDGFYYTSEPLHTITQSSLLLLEYF